MNTYLSSHPLVYLPTDIPENEPTCSILFVHPVYRKDLPVHSPIDQYTQLHPFKNLPAYLNTLFPANHENMPVFSPNGMITH